MTKNEIKLGLKSHAHPYLMASHHDIVHLPTVIVFDFKMKVFDISYFFFVWIDFHFNQWPRLDMVANVDQVRFVVDLVLRFASKFKLKLVPK